MEQAAWAVFDTSSLEVFKRRVDVARFSGGLCSVRLMVGLGDRKVFFSLNDFDSTKCIEKC